MLSSYYADLSSKGIDLTAKAGVERVREVDIKAKVVSGSYIIVMFSGGGDVRSGG